MLKEPEKLKSADFEARIESLLRDLFNRVSFINHISTQHEIELGGRRVDFIITLKAVERSWIVVVEAKLNGQPREVRNGLLQLRSYLEQIKDKNSYGLLVAPFLSSESMRLCQEAGMGFADLAGNARLSFDQVFIETRVAGNPFREKRQLRSLFSAKAGRVLRVLLTPPQRAWKVKDLEKAAGVSLGQVSNVRRLLLEREWAMAGKDGLCLSKPEELARSWQKSYEPNPLSRETLYTMLNNEEFENEMRAALKEAGNGAHAVLASYSAARWFAPYARQATHYFYADEQGAQILKSRLRLQPVERGGNVVLLAPRENDVFSARVEAAAGVVCSGLVQTWLDLNAAGERGSEAAEHLLREKLLPEWKDAAP